MAGYWWIAGLGLLVASPIVVWLRVAVRRSKEAAARAEVVPPIPPCRLKTPQLHEGWVSSPGDLEPGPHLPMPRNSLGDRMVRKDGSQGQRR